MLPTVDDLRRNAKKIHYFGLGFIQVNVSESARYNFYHKDVPAFVDEPHDHRYNFRSRVLLGSLQNDIWISNADGTLHGILENESCRDGVEAPADPIPVILGLAATFVTGPGISYSMHHATLHTVKPMALAICPTITYVEREPHVKEFARVFRAAGAEKVCPFSKKMPEADLWNIVEDSLMQGGFHGLSQA